MIRLESALGPAIARSEIHHDRPLMMVLRGVGAVLLLASLGYWGGATLGLLPVSVVLEGFCQIILGVGILVSMAELYHHSHIRDLLPSVPLIEQAQSNDWLVRVNLADYVSWELGRVLVAANTSRGELDMERFIGALLAEETTRIFFARAGLTGPLNDQAAASQAAPRLAEAVTTVEPLIQYAAIKAVEGNHRRIHLSHVLLAMAEHHQGFANLLFAHKVDVSDLQEAVSWYERNRNHTQHRFFWERGKVGIWGIGRDWAAGYTPSLSQYAVDLARYFRSAELQTQIASRTAVIDQIEAALASERQSNVLVVGLPGVGKKTVVNGFAARIASGDVPRSLANKHVMELHVSALLAGASARGQLEARLLRVLNDASRAGNIILFINNIHTLFGSEAGKIGAINAAEVLLPYLRSGRIQLIGATTPADYHQIIAQQGAVAGSFIRVQLEEPEAADALILLEDVALYLEARYDVFVPVPTLRRAVAHGARYIQGEPLPTSAIRVLEAAAVRVSNAKGHYVTTAAIDQVVTEISRVPVGDVQATEKEKLLNLEAALHARVVGQDEAITSIANAMRRARSGLSSSKRPLGSFLFLGPTGVGKTETARALADTYFGAESQMIRIDMSEFQSPASLARLIGSPTEAEAAGSGELTRKVKDAPFSLVLLDEIEKAHPDVLNIFLQILDDGRVTNGRGETVDFTNTIIIATSNAGAELIRTAAKDGTLAEGFREQLLDHIQSSGQFRPEFLNRFDAVVAFKPLTQEQLGAIVNLQLQALNKRLAEQNITVTLTPAARAKLAELGYQPEFGARALRRVMQDRVENAIAAKLLSGQVQRGETVTIDVTDLGA